MSVRILIGDVREQLRTLAADSVDCVVVSPPYWGFRDPFRKDKTSSLVGGGREQLIWVAFSIEGASWDGPPTQGSGKLTCPRWLLEKKGLI